MKINSDLSGCGCGKESIANVSEGVKLIKKYGVKCLGCLSSKIRKRVLRRVAKKNKSFEIGI